MEHEAELGRGAVGRVDRVVNVDDLVSGERGGRSGRLARSRSHHNAVRIARAVAGRQFDVDPARDTLAQQLADELLDVDVAVLPAAPSTPGPT
jgi:hypothetical protein